MKTWDLTNNATVRQNPPDTLYHAIYVFLLGHEPEAMLECHAPNNIERVVLQPLAQIDGFAGVFSHLREEDVGALVDVGFERFD